MKWWRPSQLFQLKQLSCLSDKKNNLKKNSAWIFFFTFHPQFTYMSISYIHCQYRSMSLIKGLLNRRFLNAILVANFVAFLSAIFRAHVMWAKNTSKFPGGVLQGSPSRNRNQNAVKCRGSHVTLQIAAKVAIEIVSKIGSVTTLNGRLVISWLAKRTRELHGLWSPILSYKSLANVIRAKNYSWMEYPPRLCGTSA